MSRFTIILLRMFARRGSGVVRIRVAINPMTAEGVRPRVNHEVGGTNISSGFLPVTTINVINEKGRK